MLFNIDVKNALLTTRLCQYLETQELEMVIVHNPIITFSPQKTILHQGKISNAMFIIIEGKALVTAKILGEGNATLATLERGNFMGEISLIDQGPCATSVIAIDTVQALKISRSYFDMLGLFFPQTRFKLMRAIAREVYYRLQDEYYKIKTNMKDIEMSVSEYHFGEVIKSTAKPGNISFDETGLNIHEVHRNPIFSSFTFEEFEQLLEYTSLIKVSKHHTLINRNDKKLSCYVVLKGAVQNSIIIDNKISKLSVLGPFCLFASLSCIDSTFASFLDYTTCEPAIILKFNNNDLIKLQTQSITLWYKLFELISRSVVNLERAADKLDVRLNSELYNR